MHRPVIPDQCPNTGQDCAHLKMLNNITSQVDEAAHSLSDLNSGLVERTLSAFAQNRLNRRLDEAADTFKYSYEEARHLKCEDGVCGAMAALAISQFNYSGMQLRFTNEVN